MSGRPSVGDLPVDVAERDDAAAAVGDLDADGLLAGDRGEDADVGRGERVGEVVLEVADLVHLDAGREPQLVAGDVRARRPCRRPWPRRRSGRAPRRAPAHAVLVGGVGLGVVLGREAQDRRVGQLERADRRRARAPRGACGRAGAWRRVPPRPRPPPAPARGGGRGGRVVLGRQILDRPGEEVRVALGPVEGRRPLAGPHDEVALAGLRRQDRLGCVAALPRARRAARRCAGSRAWCRPRRSRSPGRRRRSRRRSPAGRRRAAGRRRGCGCRRRRGPARCPV